MPSGTEVASKNSDLVNLDPTAIYSVTELSQNIKKVLSSNPQFNNVLLKGEVSNFARAASGHIYFNLIDERCAIACAFFRNFQETWCNDMGDGIQVVAMGSIMVYEPRSQYQLNISKIIPLGDGIISLRLKRLKDKLEGEGLFSQERKKPLPLLPRKVGILTSKDSAAITDILTVVNSQCPKMDLMMAYATIQGDGASRSIIQALKRLDNASDVDTIILARGGGPSEDFTVFNDEELVRAIASSTKPIITGIGHERNTCLADLAADVRASTPSTAAKVAVPNFQELTNDLHNLEIRMVRFYSLSIELEKKECEKLTNDLHSLKAGLERSYKSYSISLEFKDKNIQLQKEEMDKLREGLCFLKANLERSFKSYLISLDAKNKEAQAKKNEIEKLHNNLSSLRTSLDRSYRSYLLAIAAKEKELKARMEEIEKLRSGLNSLEISLGRSYNSYLKVQEKEAEIGRKKEEIKALESGSPDTFKYKAIIGVLIALLVFIIVMLLLRGVII